MSRRRRLIPRVRSALYGSARTLGDVEALAGGPQAVERRILRRLAGRIAGRVIGGLFR